MAWMLTLVKIGAEGEGPCTDVMEITRPDDLANIANLGLTLSEAKRVLAGVQREIFAAQARNHAVRRPECPHCDGVCLMKDYRDHAVSTLFGQVTLRLPRFRCVACGGIEAGLAWPSHCRSTPKLDRLGAHFCALMTYRTAADLLAQMFPVDAGVHHETLRRHTPKVGEALEVCAAIRPESAAPSFVVTLDSTFIRSCKDCARHLEVRVGNVEMASGGRQVFGAVAKADTDLQALIRCNLDAVRRAKDTALAEHAGQAQTVLQADSCETQHWPANCSGGLALLPRFRADAEPASPAEIWPGAHQEDHLVSRVRAVLDRIASVVCGRAAMLNPSQASHSHA